MYDVIVIGGGAAGMFAAITAKITSPSAKVALLEKTAVLLSKVRISGGGRCNVTHSCFDPKELVRNYPRGNKELLSAFYKFQPQDTMDWFAARGVFLKTEEDGRIFPVSNSSETIIQCLVSEAKKLGVDIFLKTRIENINKKEGLFFLKTKEGKEFSSFHLLLASGSAEEGLLYAQSFGHTIQKQIPSLFTLNVPSSSLKELSGVCVDLVSLKIQGSPISQEGPLLLTHFGFSGPAALKLSAWSAKEFFEKNYHCPLQVCWLPKFSKKQILDMILLLKQQHPAKTLYSENLFRFPKSLWKTFLDRFGQVFAKPLAHVSHGDLQKLTDMLFADIYQVEGKTTNKEEFVTCGGVTLKEVDFSNMQSKLCKGLFFAGEILDVDAVTGGFNFQNAWTTGFIAGSSMCKM